MDFRLSEEHEAIVDTVRRFVETELMPHEETVERLNAVPTELAQAIRAKALRAGLYALLRRLPKPLAGLRLRSRSLTRREAADIRRSPPAL